MVAERDRPAVLAADAALRAEDEHLRAEQPCRVPAHPDVLRPTEQVAARALAQQLRRQRQPAIRAGRVRHDAVVVVIGAAEDMVQCG